VLAPAARGQVHQRSIAQHRGALKRLTTTGAGR
jgi:hypothetical protein